MLPIHRTGTTLSMRSALAVTVSSLFILSNFVGAEPNQSTVEALLSNLPAPGSAAYRTLYETADRPHREVLDMTKAEVWIIAPERMEAVIAAATRAGVKFTKLEAAWNRPFAPMVRPPAMSAKQRTMMHGAMESKAVVGMRMMELPPPSVAEYALTKGMHDAGPNAPQPELVIPISEDKTIAVRRTSVAPVAGGYAWHGVVKETGEPVTLLWWPSGKMSGSITYHNHIYSVHNMGAGMHAIVADREFSIQHGLYGCSLQCSRKTDDHDMARFLSSQSGRPHFHYDITVRSEMLPSARNRVVLTAERNRWGLQRPSAHCVIDARDFQNVEQTLRIFGETLIRLGRGRVRVNNDRIYKDVWGQGHTLGTTRMGTSRDESVVDGE